MDVDHLQGGFLCAHVLQNQVTQHASVSQVEQSVWDAERIKVDQTQRAGVVLMLRRLIVRVQPVPVLSGRSSLRRRL